MDEEQKKKLDDCKIQRDRKLADVTRVMNSIERHIVNEDKGKVCEMMEKMRKEFDEFEILHQRYHELLSDDSDIDVSDTYFFKAQNEYVAAMKRVNCSPVASHKLYFLMI